MPGRLSFSFDLDRATAIPRSRRDPPGPMRILVVADFTGRAARSGEPDPGLASRRPRRVDVETIDARLRELAPSVTIPLMRPGETTTLSVRCLDDFHPDQLCRRLPPLAELSGLRARLDDPVAQTEAAEILSRLLSNADTVLAELAAAPSVPASAARTESDAATLARLLGEGPGRRATAPPHAAASELIRAAVAPHRVLPAAPRIGVYRAALDELASRVLRQVLRSTGLRALEGTWRGLAWLVSNAGGGEDLEWWMLDASKAEIAQDLLSHTDLSGTALWRLLVDAERGVLGGAPWSLLMGDFYFGPDPADAQLLAALGALAAACGCPFVAGAEPTLLGCPGARELPDPTRWGDLAPTANAAWQALRQTPGARWLALALPRLLLRLPYGRGGETIETLAFDEVPDPSDHEAFLWGNPALAPVLLLAQTFANVGLGEQARALPDLEDLPAFAFTDDEGTHLLPCAEVLLPERAVDAMLARGIVALVSHRDAPRVRLPALPSLASPIEGLAIPWARS